MAHWGLPTAAAVVCLLAFGQPGPADVAKDDGKEPLIVQIRQEHPRVFLTAEKIAWLRKKVEGKSLDEIKALAGKSIPGRALVYVITGDKESGLEAVNAALSGGRPGRVDIEATALCYDWCHDLLNDEQKTALQERLLQKGGRWVETGTPLRSFHNSMYTQGWLDSMAGFALYGEHPYGKKAVDFLIGEFEDALKVFKYVFYDGAWGEGYAYNHHISPMALKFFLALESASGVDMAAESPYLENNGYYIIYGAKPNGLVYPGQDNDFSYLNERDREALLLMNAKYRNPYYQRFLNSCPVERFAFPDNQKWKDLLWLDPSIPEKPVEDLPLSRIFRGEGLVFARGAWGWDSEAKRSESAWISFKCGDYFGDHAHFDNNAFEIYYKGELAIDSGRYDDDWGLEFDQETLRKSEFFNYYQRTIAHNTLVVYDPDEEMEMGIVNDGGQRGLLRVNGLHNAPKDYDQGVFDSPDGPGGRDWAANKDRWNTGDITAYLGTDLFMYVRGDATKSYSPAKMKGFVRQMLFVRPDLVIVFDRVEATNPDFRKTWLLHSVDEPRIWPHASGFDLSFEGGRLAVATVLPAERSIEKIGGPGNEFLVGGIHYTCGPESADNPSELHYGEIPGAWRIEESPTVASREDYFLNVMAVTDSESTAVPVVKDTVDDGQRITVEVTSPKGMTVKASFAKGAQGGARLEIAGPDGQYFSGEMPAEAVLEEARL